MNNLEICTSFLKDCRTISSIFVGLGKEEKLFSLYCNWTNVVWGKDPLGRPVPRTKYEKNLPPAYVRYGSEKLRTF